MYTFKRQTRTFGSAAWPLFFLLLQLLFSSTVSAGDINVSASLNASRFPEDQGVLLSVTVNGAGSARVEQPRVDGLQIVYRGQNSQIQWINGKSSQSVSFSFIVQAEKAGNYTIGPIRVEVDGTTYTTEPIRCTVTPVQASKAPPAGRQGMQSQQNNAPAARLRSGEAEQIGFMRVVPKKETIYSGELVPFTIKAYFRQGMRVTIKSAPRFVGDNFILHSIDDQPRQSEEMVNGTPYTTLTWQGTLSPVKEGTFPMEVEMDAGLLVRAKRQRPTSPFDSPFFNDPFFDDFFARYSHRDVKVASPEKKITVKDLPTRGRPGDFSGAIGTYSLAVAASPLEAGVGDPITLKMVVTGTGNFDTVQAPQLTDTRNWKTYPPSEDFEEHRPGQGKKTFEQAIVPTSGKITAIPPVSFSYFDPDSGAYVSVSSDPIPLRLKAGTSPQKTPVSASTTTQASEKQDTAPSPAGLKNLAPLHTELGNLVQAIRPLYRQFRFQAAMATALAVLLAALVLYLRRRRLAADPDIMRRREVADKIKTCLQEMESAVKSNDPAAFTTACRTAIQEKLARQWGIQARAITLADLELRLGRDNPLCDIFRQLEHAGYSGSELTENSMQAILRTLRTELEQ
jgi:hypothetical protein